MPADYTLWEIRKRNGLKLVLRLRTWKDTSFVDCREHYLADDDGDWHPTKRGVCLRPQDLPAIAAALTRAHALLRGKMVGSDPAPSHVDAADEKAHDAIDVAPPAASNGHKPKPKGGRDLDRQTAG